MRNRSRGWWKAAAGFGGILAATTVPATAGEVPEAPPVALPAPVPPEAPCACAGSEAAAAGFDFSKVPYATPNQRFGDFIIPPTGCNHYYFVDLLRGEARDKAPRNPYGFGAINNTSSFDYDFRYLDDPANTLHDWADPLKRIKIGDGLMFSTGGEVRERYVNEINSRLTGKNNDYDLLRARLYGDLWYRDTVRFFVEGIYADSLYQDLPKLPIDSTNADILNAFVEVALPLSGDSYNAVRFGRQELQFGSQRLVSTLDWANTRRTFDALRVMHRDETFDFDAFWSRPVVPNTTNLDSSDDKRDFYGAFGTYKQKPGTALDLYYLYLNDKRASTKSDTHTVGGRYSGDVDGSALFDFEGMSQFGDHLRNTPISAYSFTAGGGYRFKDAPWNPTFWAYWDYASGNRKAGDKTDDGTFNQLFPFGHYYFGFIDDVARQNISDVNFQASVNPEAWLTLIAQYHDFRLAESQDALYGAGGAVYRAASPLGKAGTDVGNEFDFVANMAIDRHSTFLIGYSVLFTGKFLDTTGPANSHRNAQLLYAQYNFRW